MWFPQLATPPPLPAWLPVGPAWERAWSLRGRSNSQHSSESPDVIGGSVSVALWTTVQVAQLNNKRVPEGLRQTAPHTRSLADWVEPYQFWQAWSLCRDLKNPLLSFSGHLSSWSGKTLCVVKLQQGMASCCWSVALQRTIAPCCYATDVEIADTASNLKNVWNIEIGWKWGLWDSWMYYFSFYNHDNWNKKLKKNKTQREKEIISIFCFLDSTDTCFIFYSSQESIPERAQPSKLAQAPNPKEIILWEVKNENRK